eukprot:m.113276 g.113276  ORF g.113276 m.113276 type:complete len:446 (+) comp28260_c0_seq4:216-1553(+)
MNEGRLMMMRGSSLEGSGPLFGSRRFHVVIMLSIANVICFADRANISVAIIPMSKSLGFDTETQGLILSAFFWGYVSMQIPTGWLCRKYGADKVLITGVLVWSLMTALTPLAANHSIEATVLVRMIMGIGEGVSQPCIHVLIANWIPPTERSRCLAIASGGSALGITIALMTSPIASRAWESVFYCFGLAGFVWVGYASLFLHSGPKSDGDTIGSRGLVVGVPGRKPSVFNIRYSSLFMKKPFVAVCIAHFCYNWTYYIVLSWVPSYFESLGVDATQVGLFAVLPYLIMYTVDVVWGLRLDSLIIKGMSLRDARVLSQGLCTLIPAAVLLGLAVYPPTQAATASVLFCAILGMMGCSHSAFWANIIDIGGEAAADLLGISNAIATIPGIVGNLYVGWVLTNIGSWSYVWFSAVVLNVVGFFFFRRWCSGNLLSLVVDDLPRVTTA